MRNRVAVEVTPPRTDERLDHEQKRRARHVEVRHHEINCAEVVARCDEEITPPAQPTRGRCGFERPGRGGADGNDPAGVAHRIHRRRRNAVPLRMDDMVERVGGADGLERIETDHEFERHDRHAHPLDSGEEFRGEVQTRGRRRGRSRVTREHRLVSLGVAQTVRDVRRERHLTDRVEVRGRIVDDERHDDGVTLVAALAHFEDSRVPSVEEDLADAQFARRAHERLPATTLVVEGFE